MTPTPQTQPALARFARLAAAVATLVGLALLTVWGALAISFDGPPPPTLASGLAVGFVAYSIAVLVALRPFRRALAAFAIGFAAVALWWSNIGARNDRDWLADVARLPAAEINGDIVTISNVRNFDYRSESDFEPRWEDRTYDLSRVVGLDLFFSYWGSPSIAHTIMSWEFDDGRHLAISIETRKEHGESYSAVRGFFRQYELYYVVADERDVVRVRTNYRGEEVYLYRLSSSPEQAAALLLAYLEEVNSLERVPEWYNALTHNCTTSIRLHVQQIGMQNPWDWRILVNGYADEMLYSRGTVNTTVPFDELREASEVTERAKAADQDPSFSQRIRQGLPARPEVTILQTETHRVTRSDESNSRNEPCA